MASIGLEASDQLEVMRLHVDAALEALVDDEIQNGAGQVAELCASMLLAGGKRLRPLLILLAHEIAGGEDVEEVMPLALAFEMIHTATLVHDDINDEASLRRGVETIHTRAGLAKAVIAGDWLFVQGFGLGGRYDENIVRLMAKCCADIAVAEFHQLDHVLNLATSPEDYLSIVRGKTAGPFAAGCHAAGLVAGLTEQQAAGLGRFGMELGIAFQLVDDLLDLRGDERMGKPRGADVLEGKMTLPLIHALTLSHGKERQRLAQLIESFSDKHFEELMQLLDRSSSLTYAEILVKTHLERAVLELDAFPESQAKSLMLHITDYVMQRHV
ncbi:MAG TPA: polyprenyl synthetase family protein [Candidatus Poseidoniales archaeon]|nr:MAG TPA: polyprenyl synthetase family protein [Candidatus Poseidoniales archaeon]